MKLFIVLVPFVFYPGVFIGLFIQYGFNPLAGLALGLTGAVAAFVLGGKIRSKGDVHPFYKNLNLGVLMVVCLILTYNIWNQAIDLKIENFAPQLITLSLALGLCFFALFIDSELNRKEQLPYYEKVQRLLNEVSLALTACVASLLTGVLLMYLLRLHRDFEAAFSFTSRILQRGVIPPLTVFLFVLGVLLLLLKFRRLAGEGKEIRALTEGRAGHNSVLYDAMMESCKWKPDRASLEAFMNLAWAKYHSFYNLPRYISWAIPILGFLGTVLGISLTAEGIGELVGSQSAIGELSSDLGKALSPLGIAFDTTLVALSLSLALVFVQLVMQRWEEKLLVTFESHMENALRDD